MKMMDLMKMDQDIDVYNDVIDEEGIALCGPVEMTEEGKERFKEVFDLEVQIVEEPVYGYPAAVVLIDDPDEKVWKKRLNVLNSFLRATAGYCEYRDYERWFVQ